MKKTELTLLDTALNNYDIQATRYYHQLTVAQNAPSEVRAKHQKELEVAKRHLESQRLNAEAMSSIQAKLDAYRAQGQKSVAGTRPERKAALNMMRTENHHPPSELEQFMQADGQPKPSPEHTAHHIVPGKGKVQETYRARTHMHMHGIRINDPDNGVWLPTFKKYTPHWSMPQALGHLEYHTHYYEYKVAQRVRSNKSEQHIRVELNLIGKLMQLNQFPIREAQV